MVSKFLRGKSIELLVTGAIVVGAVYGLTKIRAGEQIKAGAFGLGSTAGDVLTQPFAGLVTSLTKGLNDLQSTIPNFLETTGSIGADFQEFATGNRNAIGTFFDGTPEITSSKASTPASYDQSGFNTSDRANDSVISNFFNFSGWTKDANIDSLTSIADSFNPVGTTAGFYDVYLPNGNKMLEATPLQQDTIDIYKNLGYTVQRVA